MGVGIVNRVLVAGTTLHFWSQEREIVVILSREFPGEVVHRPHPRRGGSWQWSAMMELKNQLTQARCVVAAFSTVVIEAALLGCPTILVGFGNGEQGQALNHWSYEHMAGIASWPLIRIAKSESQLVALVRERLTSQLNEHDRAELRRLALRVAYCAPGIQERIAEAIEAAR